MIWKTKSIEITQAGKKKIRKNEHSLRDFWDNNKNTNICIVVSQQEEKIEIKG